MLQATLANGKLLTLASLRRDQLERLRSAGIAFYCPVCKERVMMKAGTKMIPHFAHYKKEKCPAAEHGEGMYHEQGKLLLYQWLKKQQLDVQLEKYIAPIKQRPDIFITIGEKKIAIEYQCARISINEIQSRNHGYRQEGIVPIWIVGANRLRRKSQHHLHVDEFTRQMLQTYNPSKTPVIYYFCPETLQFITIHDLLLTKANEAIGKFHVQSLHQLTFPELFQSNHFTKKEIFHIWKREKNSFRTQARKQSYGSERAWYQYLYVKGVHFEQLPSIVHLPIPSQHRMKTPTWNWQSRIVLEFFHQKPIDTIFSIKQIEHLLRKQLLSPEYFPLQAPTLSPIQQYFSILEKLRILKKRSPDFYQKVEEIPIYQHLEEAIAGDERLLEQLFFQKETKSKHE